MGNGVLGVYFNRLPPGTYRAFGHRGSTRRNHCYRDGKVGHYQLVVVPFLYLFP